LQDDSFIEGKYNIKLDFFIYIYAEPLMLPRRLSQSGQAPLGSPREAGLPSPRLRGPTTPTFDGILSGVDSRLAKRKVSSAARGDLSATDHLNDRRNPDIKEDVELSSDNPPAEQFSSQNQGATNGTSHTTDTSHDLTLHQNGNPTQAPVQGADMVAQGLSNMSISNQANGHPPNPDLSTSATPPIITDLAAVEWSYLDPQGQVQGTLDYFTTSKSAITARLFSNTSQVPSALMLCKSGSMTVTLLLTSSCAVRILTRTGHPLVNYAGWQATRRCS
jgi:hypothetical protein